MNMLTLERYVAGCASDAERAEIEASPELMARVADMRAENDAQMVLLPPTAVAERVRRRAGVTARRAPWGLVGVLVAACCVALFVMKGEETRAKGATHLVLYRQAGATAEKLHDGAVARAGDTLQVAYIAGPRDYGAIVSVDGRGSTTVHFNDALSHRGEVALPQAYTLDDAPEFERFVFVAADAPVDGARIARLLHDSPNASQIGPPGADVVIFTVRKAH